MGKGDFSNEQELSETREGIVDGESGGGTIQSEISEEKDLSSAGIKKPIFIASAESNIVKYIESALFDIGDDKLDSFLDKDEYVLLVVNPEIYHGLRQQYLFSLLKEDEQERAKNVAINEELHQKALTQALQIEYFIWNYDIETNSVGRSRLLNETNQIVFNEPELRVILNKMKAKAGEKGGISHQDTWNIMDLLVIHGFLVVENVLEETKTKEKRKWVLVVGDKDRLKILKKQREETSYLQEKYHDQELALTSEINTLVEKINKESDDDRGHV